MGRIQSLRERKTIVGCLGEKSVLAEGERRRKRRKRDGTYERSLRTRRNVLRVIGLVERWFQGHPSERWDKRPGSTR